MTFEIEKRRQENVKENADNKAATPGSELNSEEDTVRLYLLESEIEALLEVCAELLQLNTQERQDTGRKPLLKPCDIPVLELGQLKGVEGRRQISCVPRAGGRLY